MSRPVSQKRLSSIDRLLHPSLALWVLVAILLLATATRFHDLGLRSLWEDEGWTLLLAQGPTLPDIVQRLANDQHPPLFFAIFHYWRDMAGSTEFAMRMLAALTGLLAVAGVYQLGRVMFGQTAGVMAALLLAIWDHHIDLSQDVRHYAQLATLVILSSWFYWRLIRRPQPTRGTRLGYVALSMALLYTHYLGGFVLLVQALHLLVFVRPRKRLWWVAFHWAAGCAGFLPWLPIVIQQNWIRWQTPLYYLNALPNSQRTAVMVRDALLGKQYGLTLTLLLLGLVWVVYRGTGMRARLCPLAPATFALAWLVGYTAFTFYYNEQRQFLTVRNFILVTPAVVLLVGHGLANLPRGVQGLMVAVLLVNGLTTVDTRQLKAPWREVTQNITRFHNAGEPVIMDIWVGDFPARYYIEQQMGPETEWLSIRETADEKKELFLPTVLGFIQDEDAFWLMKWGDDPSPLEYENLFREAGFQRTASPYVLHAGNRLYTHRYDRLTDEVLTTYRDADGPIFALHKAAIHGEVGPGSAFTVTLWWAAERQPPADYSVSVFVLDETGRLVTQHDGPPLDGQAQTSSWQVGRLQYDQHRLRLPGDLPPGEYRLGVRVYFYQAPEHPLQTSCADDSGAACDWWLLEAFRLSGG